jgi:flagellar biosynthetic protein FliR
MDWLYQIDLEKFLLFTLVLCRISGLTATAPLYRAQGVPVQVRVYLAVALALVITPTQWFVGVEHPGTLPNYLTVVGSELLVGLSLGLGITVLFSGIHLAGQLIGRISGLMLADVFDPNLGVSVPTFSQLLFLVTTAVYLCIGGHRVLMAGLLDTFQAIPLGSQPVPVSLCDGFVLLLTQSFVLGIRAAAPVVAAVLLSTLVMGLISRTLPQLNILAVGFGMNSLLTYAMLLFTLGASAWVFQGHVEAALEILLNALEVPLHHELLL